MSRVEFNISLVLSLADVIVLEGAFGRKNTVEIINSIDMWCFPGDDKKADIGVTRFPQSDFDKANHNGRMFTQFTEESKTSSLLSPLLTRERPVLIRPSRARVTNPSSAELRPKPSVIHGFLPATVLLCATLVSPPLIPG